MKRSNGNPRLSLSKETLRTLGGEEMMRVNGGKIVIQSVVTCFSIILNCQTYSCEGSICNTDDLVNKK